MLSCRSCSKSKPVISGISTSKNNKSGCILVISFSPCLPFRAVPSKEKYGFFLSSMLNFLRATSSSSTITTLYLSVSMIISISYFIYKCNLPIILSSFTTIIFITIKSKIRLSDIINISNEVFMF